MLTSRLALLVTAVVAGPAAWATTVELPAPDELLAGTELIARVRVVDQQVELDERGRARTWSTLQVVEAATGAGVGKRLLLYQPGDPQGDRGGIIGQARHRVGDEVVLFLARARVFGTHAVVHRGLGYGVYDVRADGTLVERHSDVARVVAAAGVLPARFPSFAALALEVRAAQLRVRP